MKLADVKRLPLGTQLRLVDCMLGPCDKLRTLKIKQSNAMAFEPAEKPGSLSWLYFPKASNFQETADGFAFWEDDERNNTKILGARYVWVK